MEFSIRRNEYFVNGARNTPTKLINKRHRNPISNGRDKSSKTQLARWKSKTNPFNWAKRPCPDVIYVKFHYAAFIKHPLRVKTNTCKRGLVIYALRCISFRTRKIIYLIEIYQVNMPEIAWVCFIRRNRQYRSDQRLRLWQLGITISVE